MTATRAFAPAFALLLLAALIPVFVTANTVLNFVVFTLIIALAAITVCVARSICATGSPETSVALSITPSATLHWSRSGRKPPKWSVRPWRRISPTTTPSR